jgi:hypothetical protein
MQGRFHDLRSNNDKNNLVSQWLSVNRNHNRNRNGLTAATAHLLPLLPPEGLHEQSLPPWKILFRQNVHYNLNISETTTTTTCNDKKGEEASIVS